MSADTPAFSQDHAALLDSLAATDNLLIVQDLDGVCMGLVRDPLTRTIERRYLEAARRLDGHFRVLTNGEHIGSRGVNPLVERAFESAAAAGGHYLPGLAAGGVQLQDRHGRVCHPGVSEAELAFLAGVPAKARSFLRERLERIEPALNAGEIEALLHACVLDNPASPTLNLNELHRRLGADDALYRTLQLATEAFLARTEADAEAVGLTGAFFVHLAPNLGQQHDGRERLKPVDADSAGTTDFQFMLKGAIKEVGVLVLLNHYYHQRTGGYPLGEQFNARQAPSGLDALLELARSTFAPQQMPRIVGVGDTVTSQPATLDGARRQLRGGSDRGFLTLVQALGKAFGTDNRVLYVDSSGGEVSRPGLDGEHLRRCAGQTELSPWPALAGISDPDDPLRIDVVFCGGHREYVDFFCALAARHGATG